MKCLILVLLSFLTAANLYADKADEHIREEMKKREIPGLAITIVQNGRAVKTSSYGAANLEWGNRVTKETAFEIGSTTKQFTASAIMLLVQDGKLSLDDKIAKHLKNTPAHWTNITVRQLLNHTSGIKSYTGINNGQGFELTKRLSQEQFIESIGAYPLEYQPGDAWKYCNSAYNLLGYIIENLSGKTYFEFLGERIFNPLGMTATTNREPSVLIPYRASGYEKNRQGKLVNRDYDLTDIGAAGAIVSTVGDMAKWDAALNSEKILSAASKSEMWTITQLNNGTTKNYGLGWYVDTLEGHTNIGHSGSTSGFSASFQRFPDNKLTIIVFCNSGEGGVATALAKKIATFYLPEIVVKK
ncbi:MAG: beta-lactamase family protein [Verrucomicrobia bacterium]|nr:beta-lactamase family protein [Verrucomicrobiota bacterium]